MSSEVANVETDEQRETLTPSAASSARGRPKADQVAKVRRYNLALWRLMHGKGVALEELAIVTGLTGHSVEERAWRASQQNTDADLEGHKGVFTHAEMRHFTRRYGKSKDLDVKRFLESVGSDAERN